MSTSQRRERAVEHHLLTRCRENGFFCLKFVSPARGGVPDRIIITPTAGTLFVEVKRPGARLRRRQRVMHAKMRRFGGDIHVVDNEAGVDKLIASLLRGDGSDQSTPRSGCADQSPRSKAGAAHLPASQQRECAVEHHLLTRCREDGFFCLKFVSPARGGVPDRIVITPTAGTVFVEVKRPGAHLQRRQRLMHSKMRRFGGVIHVVDDEEGVDGLIASLLGGDGSDQSEQQKDAS